MRTPAQAAYDAAMTALSAAVLNSGPGPCMSGPQSSPAKRRAAVMPPTDNGGSAQPAPDDEHAADRPPQGPPATATNYPAAASGTFETPAPRTKAVLNTVTPGGHRMDRESTVDFLIANSCGCWAEEDRATLNGFAEERLAVLRAAAERHLADEAVLTALRGDGLVANGLRVVLNEDGSLAAQYVTANGGTPTLQDLLKYASPEDQAVWNAAVEVHKNERDRLVGLVVANAAKSRQDDLRKTCAGLDLPALRTLADAYKTPRAVRPAAPVVNYGLAAGALPAGAAAAVSPPPPTRLADQPLRPTRMEFDNPLAGRS